MRYETLHLKETFPFLGECDRDPTVTMLLPDNLAVLVGRTKSGLV